MPKQKFSCRLLLSIVYCSSVAGVNMKKQKTHRWGIREPDHEEDIEVTTTPTNILYGFMIENGIGLSDGRSIETKYKYIVVNAIIRQYPVFGELDEWISKGVVNGAHEVMVKLCERLGIKNPDDNLLEMEPANLEDGLQKKLIKRQYKKAFPKIIKTKIHRI